MGTYARYLEKNPDATQLAAERRAVLRAVRTLRGERPLLALAGSRGHPTQPAGIEPLDEVCWQDRLEDLEGEALDLVLDVPAARPETVETLLRTLRARVDDLAVLVLGWVAPAATPLALAGRELWVPRDAGLAPLLPEEPSAPAAAYLQELARAALEDGALAPEADPATVVARLADAARWHSPARALSAPTLRELGVAATTPEPDGALEVALRRYRALLQITFSRGTFKLFETPDGQLQRVVPARPRAALPVVQVPRAGTGNGRAGSPPQEPDPTEGNVAVIEIQCGCGASSKIQANLGTSVDLQDGHWAFPADDQFHCPECMTKRDLSDVRRQIEEQTKKKVVG